jgi:transposase
VLDKDLLQLALGFEAPWFVEGVDFSPAEKRIDITVAFPKGSRFPCPECAQAAQPVHDTQFRTWRHLDFFQHQAHLHAKVPRITCDHCGVKQVVVGWARPGSGFTLLFEALVVQMAVHMAVDAVAGLVRVNPDSVWRILKHYVDKTLQDQDLSQVSAIGIDETSRRKGHQYVSTFCDLDESRVVFVTEGKDAATVGAFVADLTAHGGDPGQITEVCSDMSEAFIAGIAANLPNARHTFDRYHVMALANKAVDEVRRAEAKTVSDLKKSRYLWLKNPGNLNVGQTERLASLSTMNLKTGRAYQLKLALQELWTYRHPFYAEQYLKKWYFWATHSRLEPIKALAKTIKRHWDGILAFVRSRVTNGLVEGLNAKIKMAAKRAFGFKTFEYYRIVIYLVAGKLDLRVAG